MGLSSCMWSHLGLNQGPPDYESGATNQLSYRTIIVLFTLASVAEEHQTLVFRDLHLFLRQFRDRQFRSGNERIRIRNLLLISNVDVYPAIGVVIILTR